MSHVEVPWCADTFPRWKDDDMLKVSDRSDISPFIVMDVMRMSAAREAAGEHVLHLEVGQPDTPAPLAVRAAARAAINTDKIGYTVALGLDALRERIARHYLSLIHI